MNDYESTSEVAEFQARAATSHEETSYEAKKEGKKKQRRLMVKRSEPFNTARTFCGQRAGKAGKALTRYRNTFYVWTGTHYRKADTEEVRREIWRFLAKAWTNVKTDQGLEERPFNPTPADVTNIFDALLARPEVEVSNQLAVPAWLPGANPEWNRRRRPGDLLACKSKILNLITGELWEPSPYFLTMNAVEYDYDPEATAPRFQRFLDEIFPGSMSDPTPEQRDAMDDAQRDMQRRRKLVLEIFGYLLSGDLRQQKIFLFMGKKRSGKGTLARVLKQLLGPQNVIGMDLEEIGETFGMEDMIDKTTAIIGDARLEGRGAHKLVTRLLSISGQDAITVNRKNEKKWHGTLGVRFLILTNPLLHFTDASGVIASRFIPVQFTESFEGRENTGLTEELLEELPGILNLAMQGLRRLRGWGYFELPASSEAAIDRILRKAAPIFGFIDDRAELGADCSESREKMFEEYCAWADDNKHKPMTKTSFVSALEDADPSIKCMRPRAAEGEKRSYRFFGIRLRRTQDARQAKSPIEEVAEVIDIQSRRV
jgi:putative DNA primase/helicase